MADKIVLLDVDKTLLDVNYQLTVPPPEFAAALDRAEAAGLMVGLNSDTPLQSLVRLTQPYGVRGPIVAELGGVVTRSPTDQPELAVPEAAQLASLRPKLLARLATDPDQRFLTGVGDALALPEWERGLPLDGPASIAVLVNGFRLASVSFWVRGRKGSAWDKDETALDAAIAQLEPLGQALGELWTTRQVDRNPEYGICIVHAARTRKALGVQHLRRLFPGASIAMVGDKLADWIDDPEVVHYAVGNAAPDFKQRCAYVAHTPMTAGVIEILRHLES